jgi:chemotaxis protein CheD
VTTGRDAEGLGSNEQAIHVIQGEFFVTGDRSHVLTTVLGSCIAACIRDPVTGVGGMNHFLLPGEAGDEGLRYGVNAMELLVNGILKKGARRERLEAKIFGGAKVMQGLPEIGLRNAALAEAFCRDEGITMLRGSVGGVSARRIQFWPGSGRTRQLAITDPNATAAQPVLRPAPVPLADEGAVELF